MPVTLATHYRFPKGGRFDAEGLFIDGGRAVVVAKTFDRREAELFAVPLDPPAPLLRPVLPEPAGTLPGFTEPATGAGLSRRRPPPGRLLATTWPASTRRTDGGAGRSSRTVRYEADGIEAICWDGDDLILAGEGRGMYRIASSPDRGRQAVGPMHAATSSSSAAA